MGVATAYVRHYSEIGSIQKEKSVRYELVNQPDGYGIRVTLDSSGRIRSDCQERITSSREEAMELLTFLYENAVPIDTWRDLTSDVLDSLHTQSLCG